MKHFYFILIPILLLNCKANSSNEIAESDDWKVYYFDFDAVDHYRIDSPEMPERIDFPELDKNSFDLLRRIVSYGFPTDMEQISFIDSLEDIGFKKKIVPEKNHDKINELYREKGYDINYAEWMCMPTYRDLLVFKKQDSIVGVSKICFDCDQVHTIGTTANTSNFRAHGSTYILYDILWKDTLE